MHSRRPHRKARYLALDGSALALDECPPQVSSFCINNDNPDDRRPPHNQDRKGVVALGCHDWKTASGPPAPLTLVPESVTVKRSARCSGYGTLVPMRILVLGEGPFTRWLGDGGNSSRWVDDEFRRCFITVGAEFEAKTLKSAARWFELAPPFDLIYLDDPGLSVDPDLAAIAPVVVPDLQDLKHRDLRGKWLPGALAAEVAAGTGFAALELYLAALAYREHLSLFTHAATNQVHRLRSADEFVDWAYGWERRD